MFDLDGDGHISVAELKHTIESWEGKGSQLTLSQAEEMLLGLVIVSIIVFC